MKTSWTQGLSPEQAIEIKKDFKGCFPTRKRLVKLLEDKIVISQKASLSKDAYSYPNWSFLQADNIGYQRALNDVISLILDDSVEK